MRKIILCQQESSDSVKIVANRDRLKAFMLWRSQNDIEESIEDIVASFDLEDFSIEDMLTFVKSSRFFSEEAIDKRILYLVKENRTKMAKLRTEIGKYSDAIPFKSMIEIDSLISFLM